MTDIDIAVSRLVRARHEHQPQPAPTLADATAAYAAQERVARELAWFGTAPPRYWKSGGASRAAVISHAPLPPAGVWISPAQAGTWPEVRGGIEAEVALRLREPVDAERAATLDLSGIDATFRGNLVPLIFFDTLWRFAYGLADERSYGCDGHGG